MEQKQSSFDTLNACFDTVIFVTKKLRQENESFDGLKFWEESLKPMIMQISDSSFSYQLNGSALMENYKLVSGKELTNSSVNVKDFSLDEFKDEKLIEHTHFFLQQFRVPLKEKTFTRLMQIAYNIGQLSTCLDKLPSTLSEKYAKTNLANMSAYVISIDISFETCTKIQEITNKISKLTW